MEAHAHIAHSAQTQLFLLRPSLDDAFARFHAENPEVYERLVRLARLSKARGMQKVGIGMLFEVLRWQTLMRTRGEDYKLNNNYRSRYARMLMEREPDLAGMFETRELRS